MQKELFQRPCIRKWGKDRSQTGRRDGFYGRVLLFSKVGLAPSRTVMSGLTRLSFTIGFELGKRLSIGECAAGRVDDVALDGDIPCLFQTDARVEEFPDVADDDIVSDDASDVSCGLEWAGCRHVLVFAVAAFGRQTEPYAARTVQDDISFDDRVLAGFPEKRHVGRQPAVGAVYVFKAVVRNSPPGCGQGIDSTGVAPADDRVDVLPALFRQLEKAVRHRPVIAKIAAGGVGLHELLPGIDEVQVVQPRMVASADDVDMVHPARLMVKSAMVMCSAAIWMM